MEAPAAVLRESSTKVVMELIRSRMEVVLKPLQSCSKEVIKKSWVRCGAAGETLAPQWLLGDHLNSESFLKKPLAFFPNYAIIIKLLDESSMWARSSAG